jgi:hypothetical protein
MEFYVPAAFPPILGFVETRAIVFRSCVSAVRTAHIATVRNIDFGLLSSLCTDVEKPVVSVRWYD